MGKVLLIRHSDDDQKDYHDKYGLHFSKELVLKACSEMINNDKSNHSWTCEQVEKLLKESGIKLPEGHTIEDVTYTANMAYADFFPTLLNERQCIDYAILVASDPDGYEGIEFSRWLADVKQKHIDIDLNKFI